MQIQPLDSQQVADFVEHFDIEQSLDQGALWLRIGNHPEHGYCVLAHTPTEQNAFVKIESLPLNL